MTPFIMLSSSMRYHVLLSLVASLARHFPPWSPATPLISTMGLFIPYTYLPCFPKVLDMGPVYSPLHDFFAMLLMELLIPSASLYLDPLPSSSWSGAPISWFSLPPLDSYLVSANLPCVVSLFPTFLSRAVGKIGVLVTPLLSCGVPQRDAVYVTVSTAIFDLPYPSVNSNEPFGNLLINGSAVVRAISISLSALSGIVALLNTTKNCSRNPSSKCIGLIQGRYI